jgi:hypothetical protein
MVLLFRLLTWSPARSNPEAIERQGRKGRKGTATAQM